MSEEQIAKYRKQQVKLVSQICAIERKIAAIDLKIEKLGGTKHYG